MVRLLYFSYSFKLRTKTYSDNDNDDDDDGNGDDDTWHIQYISATGLQALEWLFFERREKDRERKKIEH